MINKYIKSAPKTTKINWWDLPDWINLELNETPEDIKKLGEYFTIGRLKSSKIKKEIITNYITNIKLGPYKKTKFTINFPIELKNNHYSRFYALMVSEGSYRTEFGLNVPETELHEIFKDSIKNLISEEARNNIRYDYNHGCPRSRAPAILRYMIPIPNKIPKFIIKNKEFSRDYLKTSFECEGSPIYDKKQYKRYIKLSRYVDISKFVTKEKIPLMKRIYLNNIKKDYKELFKKIENYPPETLLGEYILLKKHFDIDSKLQLEAIRKNKVSNRVGKITARWVLSIYANNIDKFIKEIGFLSKNKNKILEEMKKVRGNNPQYYALNVIINKIKNDKGCFSIKDFMKEMKAKGYKSPAAYIWRYYKSKKIKKIKRGYYKIL